MRRAPHSPGGSREGDHAPGTGATYQLRPVRQRPARASRSRRNEGGLTSRQISEHHLQVPPAATAVPVAGLQR